jgi:hypothetical protein
MNDKVYIHELVEIRGQRRADYMHHMTANWVPEAIRERNQRCFGVWGTVGSTGRWPEVVNLWELDGWAGLAANFAHELRHPDLQDPTLRAWWAEAAGMRRGGFDRILVPAPWTLPIAELLAAGVRGELFAHELVRLPPGRAQAWIDALDETGRPAVERCGLRLVGAFRVVMVNDSEGVAIWAVPDEATWATFEQAWDDAGTGTGGDGPVADWRAELHRLGADWHRTLMVAAPLSPLRLGRQPTEADRDPAGRRQP